MRPSRIPRDRGITEDQSHPLWHSPTLVPAQMHNRKILPPFPLRLRLSNQIETGPLSGKESRSPLLNLSPLQSLLPIFLLNTPLQPRTDAVIPKRLFARVSYSGKETTYHHLSPQSVEIPTRLILPLPLAQVKSSCIPHRLPLYCLRLLSLIPVLLLSSDR